MGKNKRLAIENRSQNSISKKIAKYLKHPWKVMVDL